MGECGDQLEWRRPTRVAGAPGGDQRGVLEREEARFLKTSRGARSCCWLLAPDPSGSGGARPSSSTPTYGFPLELTGRDRAEEHGLTVDRDGFRAGDGGQAPAGQGGSVSVDLTSQGAIEAIVRRSGRTDFHGYGALDIPAR